MLVFEAEAVLLPPSGQKSNECNFKLPKKNNSAVNTYATSMNYSSSSPHRADVCLAVDEIKTVPCVFGLLQKSRNSYKNCK